MINKFEGKYKFLSNFWPSTIALDYAFYPSVEHAYQAAKTTVIEERCRILECKTAGKAKKMGRGVTLRSDWESIKEEIMLNLLRQKFSGILGHHLLGTGQEELIEGNSWHDNFWGACDCLMCESAPKLNKLGKLLMQVRSEHDRRTG